MKRISLYDYQRQMLADITGAFGNGTSAVLTVGGIKVRMGASVMVQMPTGTGKTYVMAAVVGWFLDTHAEGDVWIVAHRRELVEQMERTLHRFGLDGGTRATARKGVSQGRGSNGGARVRVLSIQWLARHADETDALWPAPGLIIVDEAHHAIADTYQDLFVRHAQALKLGMTATPCRMKKASFGNLFGRLLVSPPTEQFIERGYLAPYSYVVTGKFSPDQLAVNLLRGRGSDGDYAIREMDERLNVPQAIQRLYDSVQRYAPGKKGIVYAIDIAHAQAIAACYNALGMRSVALDSTTPARQRHDMVERFREGQIDCLVNVNLFDEGFDCPDVEYIQMARPTLSLAKYLQMVGRGLRIDPTDRDKVCVIIDNVGNCRKFGLPDRERDWPSMFAGLKAGKGAVPSYVRKMHGITAVCDEMVTVKTVNRARMKMTARELRAYLKDVRPFQRDGLWGLRVADDIVLNPIYLAISPFTGDLATFRIADRRCGVLGRNGKVLLTPEYKRVKLMGDNMVKVTRPDNEQSMIKVKGMF